jgi:predicted nucleic acid-binding protein
VIGFLLDTNVISEAVRLEPDSRVLFWLDSVQEDLLHLSVLTFGEIRQGVALLAEGKRRLRLERWLETELRMRFAGRIVPIDEDIAERWGGLTAEARRAGTPLGVVDGLLAATALEHGLTLATRNVKDFVRLGVTLSNPWSEGRKGR